ncbi:ABC transporter ATP-binding protein [Pikeienuella sp. HZG-20]|uniref:ABC transporter ATP-binding protein n=1 Tax=Paludibacillus litoralis TaxID=3133267 RepID=UPI0030ECCC13
MPKSLASEVHRPGPRPGGAAEPGGEVALVCRDVTARYGRIQVCNGISLTLRAGEVVAILGPNGAGKSSFLGAVSGLVHGGGAIELGGVDIGKMPAHARAQAGVAFVPEIRGNICPALSIDENLALGLRMIKGDRAAALDHVFSLFPILKERLRTPAGMLSGGEQQMLAIGMAAARRPRVLLLDEPTQGLAPAIHEILRETFEHFRADGLALAVAEQNVAFAASIASRFLMLVDGAIVMTGGRAELDQHDTILSSFLGNEIDDDDTPALHAS